MDAAHYFGSDLAFSAGGDLLAAEGMDEATQRLLRRLLTCAQDYLWQPEYGAGLPAFIGLPLDAAGLGGLIKAQMYLEGGVSHAPEPEITLQEIPSGISVQVRYTSSETGRAAALGFDVTP